MTDIDGTVVAIQGHDVANTNPDDGYVLTYDAGDAEWQPKPVQATGLRTACFTVDDTWTCPDGVYNVLAIGCGGGGGGAAYGPAGGGALQQTGYISVTPGLTYDIEIGAGGTGGIGGVNGGSYPTNQGNDGLPTKFSYSSSILFLTRGGGGANSTSQGGNCANMKYAGTSLQFEPAAGGIGSGYDPYRYGNVNYINDYSGGIPGTGYTGSGNGGGAGPYGNGANGGNGHVSGNGENGYSAAANSGAGGGSGSAGDGSQYNSGDGGNGGSGAIRLIW